VVLTNKLGVHRQDHQSVHRGTGCLMCPLSGCHVLWLSNEEYCYDALGCDCSSTCVKRSNKVVSTQFSKIMTAECVGLLEVENSVAGPGFRVAQQAESCSVRIPVQPQWEVHVRLARSHWPQKHTIRGCTPCRAMPGEICSPKEGAVKQQQCKIKSTKSEG
jgi:hypothetical protein